MTWMFQSLNISISKDKSEKAKEGTGKAWGGTKSFAGRTKQKV